MPAFAATLLVVYSLLIALISSPVYAQPQKLSDENGLSELPKYASQTVPTNTTVVSGKKKVDLKKVFDEETKKFNADNAKFDPDKIEREKARQTQKKWGTKQTVFIVVFAAAVAVLVWFVLKY